METPCEWAAKAVSMQGKSFTLTAQNGKVAEVKLFHAGRIDLGGGYVGYTFSFIGPLGGPSEDDIYAVNGPAGQSELFCVVSEMPEHQISYVASVTCQAS